jgi:hypothetical protein
MCNANSIVIATTVNTAKSDSVSIPIANPVKTVPIVFTANPAELLAPKTRLNVEIA